MVFYRVLSNFSCCCISGKDEDCMSYVSSDLAAVKDRSKAAFWLLVFLFLPPLFMLPGIEQALFTHDTAFGIQTLLAIYNSL